MMKARWGLEYNRVGGIKLNFGITRYTIIISIILVVSFILRAYGNNFGLPQLFHPDEPQIIERAIRIAQTGDLNPHWFFYPSLLFYIDAIIIKFELILNWFGLMHADRSTFYLSSRFLSAVCGSLTILAVYYIGKILYNGPTGITAAVFLAIMPLAVIDSHYATTDIPMTFFSTLCILFAALMFKNNKLKYYTLAGVAAGLAISTKYTAGIFLIAIFTGHFLSIKWNNGDYSIKTILNTIMSKNLILSLVLSGMFFLIGTPYSLLDFKTFEHDLASQSLYPQTTHGILFLGTAPGWVYHLENSLKTGMTINLEILSILGVLYSLLLFSLLYGGRTYKSNDVQSGILLLSSILPYYLIMSSWGVKFDRYVIPLLPFLALLGASLLVDAANFISEKIAHFERKGMCKNVILCVAVITLIIAPTQISINIAEVLAREDTRQIALSWIEANIPKNSTVIREWYTPEVELIKNIKCISYGSALNNYDLREFKTGVDYIIISSAVYARFYAHPTQSAREIAFYESLNNSCELIKLFKFSNDNLFYVGPNVKYHNPEIKIYKIPKTSVEKRDRFE